MMAVGFLVLVVVTILGAMGFRGREQVVGIDLGTTFSVVAVKLNSGEVRVIPDYTSQKRLTPSVVHYPSDGKPLVGARAVPYRQTHPLDTIYNSKRFIGKRHDEVEAERKDHPYNVVPGINGTGNATFQLPLSGLNVTAIDVGADIVRHMYKSILENRGYPMTTAVICIPAKFGMREADATKIAFEKAGFKVLRVMDEPTAAAVAYNLHKTISPRNILVYDFGGGTLDASLLWMNGDAVTMLGTSGDDHLGGSDFDHIVQRLLSKSLPKCDGSQLGLLAEQAKIELSDAMTAKVECGEEQATLTREEFEEATNHLFVRALEPIDAILKESMMDAAHVSDVVLVGGATRMPKIRQLLRDYFPEKTPVHTHIDPDTTVAIGAANIY